MAPGLESRLFALATVTPDRRGHAAAGAEAGAQRSRSRTGAGLWPDGHRPLTQRSVTRTMALVLGFRAFLYGFLGLLDWALGAVLQNLAVHGVDADLNGPAVALDVEGIAQP